MSVQVKGLQELVDKLESLTDEKVVTQIQKKALKKKANGLLREMQNETPVSTVRDIHGIDAENIISFRYDGRAGYRIGITNQGGSGADYWEQIRGVWFQNFKTDEPNFGWWTNLYQQNRDRWMKEAREDVKVTLQQYIDGLGLK